MKTPIILVSLLSSLCLAGCSGNAGPSPRLVPATAAEVMASPEFRLAHTTRSGIRCYVREISPEIARAIPQNSPDRAFLADDEKPYLLVVVREGRIVDLTAAETGLSTREGLEVATYSMKRAFQTMTNDPGIQKLLEKIEPK
jgi:hypothetical protein